MLEAAGLENPIHTRGPGYIMVLRRDQLDLSVFEDRLERGDAALSAGNATDAADELRGALALWRGAALVDVSHEEFARAAAMRLEELRVHALELRIDADFELGQHERLVGELQSLVKAHPLNERLRGQLMRALYGTGRQSEALETYRSGRELLVGALGIEPGPALQALERQILQQDPGLETTGTRTTRSRDAEESPPERSLLVLPTDEAALDALLPLAEPMARHPPHELIVLRLVAADDELAEVAAGLNERREQLVEQGIVARAAAFTSASPGSDAVQLAHEQDVALVLADLPTAGGAGHMPPGTLALLDGAPCDVALLARRGATVELGTEHSVVVPFGGADHDWAAVELAAWIAGAHGSRLKLAGVGKEAAGHGRGASRLLARASLLLQKAIGVAAEPLLVEEGADALADAVTPAGLVVAGLSSREGRRELGSVRLALVKKATPPVLLVREGLRPGGLAPAHTMTRFTWSMTRA